MKGEKNVTNLNCIPKKYRDSIYDFWKDEDGWWIMLKEDSEYIFSGYYSTHTIHEDTKADAIREFKTYITERTEAIV